MAVESLGQLQEPRAIEPLIRRLKDSSVDVRRAAAGVLGQLNDARAVKALIRAIRDSDGLVRMAAVEMLGRLKDSRAMNLLNQALKDTDSDVQEAAAKAFGELGSVQAVEPLIVAFNDSRGKWCLRREIANAFVKLGAVCAVEPLIGALRNDSYDDDFDTCCVIAEALNALLLADRGAGVSQSQLNAIVQLPDRETHVYYQDRGWRMGNLSTLDLSNLRQLAREELARREFGAASEKRVPERTGPTTPSISVACSHCQKKLRVSAKHAGRHVQCPACQESVVIPML